MTEELAVIEHQEYAMLGAATFADHKEVIKFGTMLAKDLADIIEKQHLYKKIGNSKHVLVEGWGILGSFIGLTALESKAQVIEHDDGTYEATVEIVREKDGAIVGRGSAICGIDESNWANKPRYARRSMAITRAAGKAWRLKLSWIIALAGYNATPAEEMDFVEGEVRDVTPKKNGPRPYSPEQLRQRIQEKSAGYQTEFDDKTRMELHQNIRGAVVGNLEMCFAGDPDSTHKRHSLQAYLFGIDSFNDLSDGQVMALKQWLNATEDSGGQWAPDPVSVKEAQAVVTERMKNLGQDELPMGEAPKEADTYMKED